MFILAKIEFVSWEPKTIRLEGVSSKSLFTFQLKNTHLTTENFFKILEHVKFLSKMPRMSCHFCIMHWKFLSRPLFFVSKTFKETLKRGININF